MLLMTPSDPLRDRNLTIFNLSRPSKPSFSVEKVDLIEVFTVFYLNGLLDLSSRHLGSIWGSSGHLRGSSGDHFSCLKGEIEI